MRHVVARYLRLAQRKRFVQHRSLELAAVSTGVLAGIMGAFFQLGTEHLSTEKNHLANFLATENLSNWMLSGIMSSIMLLAALWLVRRFAPEAAGSGIQDIEGFLEGVRPARWWRVLPIKFFGGLLALGSGMVLGREGPSIQMGGNTGALINDALPRNNATSAHALVAAGAAAGLAAAFNAPLAGVVFVMEEMRDPFRHNFLNIRLITIAVLIATLVANTIVGQQPAIAVPVYDRPAWGEMFIYLLMGGVLGLAGATLSRCILLSLDLMDRLKKKASHLYLWIAALGFAIGALHLLYPDIVGGGYGLIDRGLDGSLFVEGLALVILIRFLLTVICFCSGVPGGVFAPMIILGTLIGLWCGDMANQLFPDIIQNPYPFAIAGMGALFAATVQAPITGIILVVEMTSNYSLIVPIMIACVGADIVAHELGTRPLYAVLLERALQKEDKK